MKLVDFDNPVRASWLTDQGSRLDPGPYVSDTYAARMFLRSVPKQDRLEDVTERMFHAGRVTRNWTTSKEHGVPFLGSADIFEADLSHTAFITRDSAQKNPNLLLEPGWTLITRSGMTAGRVTYARREMDGFACSEDVLRVVANDRIPAGYLYTFLASHYGTAMIKGGIYGTSIKHIEPPHLADIPVPRLSTEIEQAIHSLIWKAMDLRSKFQSAIVMATRDLFDSAGLSALADYSWHDEPRDLDFSITGASSLSLRALNFSPRAQRLIKVLRSVPFRTLAEVCEGGTLRTGARFKRIEADQENGVRLIGQRQAFWLRPTGRWINPQRAPRDIMQTDETILIAAHGTLGETEVYSRSILVTGSWLKNAFSQDFVRVASGDTDYPGAFLFAFFRSEVAFRILRSMSVGGKQQEYHTKLIRELPIPECTPTDRERIAETVRQAYRWRDEADVLEDRAFEMLDEAVREAAR